MEIFAYQAGSNEVEEGFTVADLPKLLQDDKAVIWADMEAPSLADDRILSDVFHFHPLTIEDCRANRHHPKVEEFPDYIYFIVHAVRTDASPERFNTIKLDGFLGRNSVVMISDDKIASENIVELDGVEALRTGVSPNSMHYEINVIGKLLDLGMVAVRAAVLNCKGVKVKDVGQNAIVSERRCFHIGPNYGLIVLQQLRKVRNREALLHFV